MDMGMGTGMGQWLIWGILGIVALAALITMGGWLRRNKVENIADTSSTGDAGSITADSCWRY